MSVLSSSASISALITSATSQSEIDRLEDVYCDYCDDYKDDCGFRPHNKDIITEEQIKAYYARQKA